MFATAGVPVFNCCALMTGMQYGPRCLFNPSRKIANLRCKRKLVVSQKSSSLAKFDFRV
jgi:hypothetical protein